MTEEREMTAPMTTASAEVGQSLSLKRITVNHYLNASSNSSSE